MWRLDKGYLSIKGCFEKGSLFYMLISLFYGKMVCVI